MTETTRLTVEETRDKVLPILRQYGAMRAGFFGSLVRGELQVDSDIDILVDLPRNLSLLDLSGIALELEAVLGRKVDLVEYDSIHPLIKEKVLAQEVRIL